MPITISDQDVARIRMAINRLPNPNVGWAVAGFRKRMAVMTDDQVRDLCTLRNNVLAILKENDR